MADPTSTPLYGPGGEPTATLGGWATSQGALSAHPAPELLEEPGELTLLTWVPEAGSLPSDAGVEDAYRALDAALGAARGVVLLERIFGTLSVADPVLKARTRATGGRDAWSVPPTFIEGRPVGGEGLAGIHVVAARADQSRLLTDGALVLGRVVETPVLRLMGLMDVGRLAASNLARGPAADAEAAIGAAERLLDSEGCSFRDVVRTWYYLSDILDWYGPFNAVRNAAFRRMGLIGPGGDGAVPASTGIEGRGARGAWCTLDLVAAWSAQGGSVGATRLHNRRQNEATEYGSAFARGMAVTLGRHRYLFVSGTASIDHRGATVHVGDVEAQTTHAIEAIEALLEGAGASLQDIGQATVFLKRPGDVGRYESIARRVGIDLVPSVVVAADVCREDLLVEIDATAVVPLRPVETGP